jgi:hypothetical protein
MKKGNEGVGSATADHKLKGLEGIIAFGPFPFWGPSASRARRESGGGEQLDRFGDSAQGVPSQ